MKNSKILNLKLINILNSEYLGGRLDGSIIREQIENFLSNNPQKQIVIDFKGIKVASHSFIDEIVGYPLRLQGKDFLNRIKFKNTNSSIKITIKTILAESLQKTA